jgi:hypothetical protein
MAMPDQYDERARALRELLTTAISGGFPESRRTETAIIEATIQAVFAYARAVADEARAEQREENASRASAKTGEGGVMPWPNGCFAPNEAHLRARIAELERERDDLRTALVQAREDMIGWAAYADEYFRDKHDLAGDLAAIDKALEKSK